MTKKNEELDQKLDEIISQKKEGTENQAAVLPLPICVSLDAALGLIIGSVMNNISLGLCIGLAVGCGAYGIIMFIVSKKKKRPHKNRMKRTFSLRLFNLVKLRAAA